VPDHATGEDSAGKVRRAIVARGFPYFVVYVDLVRHPKVNELGRIVGSVPAARGYLVALWSFTAEFFGDGRIPNRPGVIEDLERLASWVGDPCLGACHLPVLEARKARARSAWLARVSGASRCETGKGQSPEAAQACRRTTTCVRGQPAERPWDKARRARQRARQRERVRASQPFRPTIALRGDPRGWLAGGQQSRGGSGARQVPG
jgi:hypothetical protein